VCLRSSDNTARRGVFPKGEKRVTTEAKGRPQLLHPRAVALKAAAVSVDTALAAAAVAVAVAFRFKFPRSFLLYHRRLGLGHNDFLEIKGK